MLRLSLVCLLSLHALSVRSTSEKIPPSVEKPPRVLELKDIWPDGDYCILKGPSACPPNFEKHRTRLSVQQIFTTEEKRRDGSMAISTGTFGESGLTSDSYDDLYSLDLVTCCRIPS